MTTTQIIAPNKDFKFVMNPVAPAASQSSVSSSSTTPMSNLQLISVWDSVIAHKFCNTAMMPETTANWTITSDGFVDYLVPTFAGKDRCLFLGIWAYQNGDAFVTDDAIQQITFANGTQHLDGRFINQYSLYWYYNLFPITKLPAVAYDWKIKIMSPTLTRLTNANDYCQIFDITALIVPEGQDVDII